MKEEALKLAVWLENMSKLGWADNFGQELDEISAMIRRLVEELDTTEKAYKWTEMARNAPTKPLSDEEMKVFKEIIRISDRKNDLWDKAKTILERHGIK